jgi:hypothetical protein
MMAIVNQAAESGLVEKGKALTANVNVADFYISIEYFGSDDCSGAPERWLSISCSTICAVLPNNVTTVDGTVYYSGKVQVRQTN